MAKNEVNVIIKARDNASKKFRHIGSSAVGMGNMIKKAALAAGVFFGARALKRFADSAIEAAATQQKADNLLREALLAQGVASKSSFRDLKRYAGELQKVTLYGDEATEAQMTLGLNMGISSDRIKEATKGAIGLAAAFKIDVGTAMKLVALAFQGEYTMMARYVPALRAAKTEGEKFAIVQKAMADGFKQAKKEAEEGLGPIIQMKNALGDAVRESIGFALLPIVQESARRIKKWAEDNQGKIGMWAEITVSKITLVKDVFGEFISFMRDDWRSGLSFAFDAFVKIAKGAFETVIELSIMAGKGMFEGIKKGFLGGPSYTAIQEKMEEIVKRGGMHEEFVHGTRQQVPDYPGVEFVRTSLLTKRAEGPAGVLASLESQAREEATAADFKKIAGDSFDNIMTTWKTTMADIKVSMPKALGDGVDKAIAKDKLRVAVIQGKYFINQFLPIFDTIKNKLGALFGVGAKPAIPVLPEAEAKKVTKAISQQPLAAVESRFLTMAGRRDPAIQTEKNTSIIAKATTATVKAIDKLTDKIDDVMDNGSGATLSPSNMY